ncbi:MAG TPA: hypothetical protein VFQ61_10185 [Polyangiaceae bacterium]|nr:hypothetical protein [Polyangiaceae bacterium]
MTPTIGANNATGFVSGELGWTLSTPLRRTLARSPRETIALPTPEAVISRIGLETKRRLARCEAHGLHYDSDAAGCVLCRKSLAPAPSRAPVAATPLEQPTLGTGTWLRLVLLVPLVGLVAVLTAANEGRPLSAMHAASAFGSILLAALLCGIVGRWRNNRAFSKVALVFALLSLGLQLADWTRARTAAARVKGAANTSTSGGAAALQPVRAPLGNIELRLPASWTLLDPGRMGPYSAGAASPRGDAVFAQTEPLGRYEARVDLAVYGELVRSRKLGPDYALRYGLPEARTISGVPAERCSMEGTFKGAPMNGYLYVVKGATGFVNLVAYATPERWQTMEQELVTLVEHSRLDEGATETDAP